jgi:hypothetical protein
MARIQEVEAVDRFLADEKRLNGSPPEFGPSHFGRRGDLHETVAVWPVEDARGIVAGGEICLIWRPVGNFSVSLIFRSRAVARLDFTAPNECKSNPIWARTLGLPAQVCGPHIHDWRHNRDHILAQAMWDIPCREPLPPQIRRFEQAWPWLADRLNLVLTPDQRLFELPRKLI